MKKEMATMISWLIVYCITASIIATTIAFIRWIL